MQRQLIRLARVLPSAVMDVLMAPVIPFYVLFDGKGRRASYRFFRQRLGMGRWKSCVHVFKNMFGMGRVVLDRFAAYGGKSFRMVFEGELHYQRLIGREGGFVLLGSHVGNFELVGYTFPAGKPMKVLVYEGETDTVMENRKRLFSRGDIEMVPVRKDLSHLFALNAALAAGELVAVSGDRSFGSGRTCRCPFLGADAAFPTGPFQLAVSREVPALAAFVMREGRDSYRVIQELLPAAGTPQELAAAYAAALEKVVRRYPDQWYNFYDFWA